MRIVICGSVALPVPPPMQGGTEWIAYHQAKGLSEKGHQIFLIAAKGSKKGEKYQLEEIGTGDTVAGSSLNKFSEATETSRNLRKEIVALTQVSQWLIDHQSGYDLILNNMRGAESIFLPIAKMINKPIINVMHLPLFPELSNLFQKYHTPIITISNNQRKNFPSLYYLGTVNNGIEMNNFTFNEKKGEYLLMMGSITPHKNQKAAVEVAKKSGIKLIIAGKIGNSDYYEREIEPLIDGKNIVRLGEVDFAEKIRLYQNAKALLFPILWEEPFGLVMIEAMACGTPVVAFNHGAIPEVIKDGETGFIVEENDKGEWGMGKSESDQKLLIQKKGIEGLIEAVQRIDQIDRIVCRKHVEDNFTVEKMTAAYQKTITKIVI